MKLYNTLKKQKEEFKPGEQGKVKMYVCGPTTYNYIHLGNARPIVVFDVVRRYLEYRGYQVTYIQNFTDVDDKIINRAAEEGIEPLQLAENYIKEYFKDADQLNVRRADVHPKVSEHIGDIVSAVEKLIEDGYAYEQGGNVYYSIEKFSNYGKLSGRSIDDMQAGARIEVNQEKKHPMDFVLWKNAKEGEPSWESPWGQGRPGWHIECTVMSIKYLGENFDIHGGGYDLVFPHHENEIAQSEAYTGSPFARYWIHNGFITVNQEKMSKSLGNFFLVREILEKFDAQVVRFYLLSTHYRSPLDFDDEKLEVSKKSFERITNTYQRLLEVERIGKLDAPWGEYEKEMDEKVKELKLKFEKAMDDDFNTSLAIAAIFDWAKDVNQYLHSKQEREEKPNLDVVRQSLELVNNFGQVLGLDFSVSAEAEGSESVAASPFIELLLEVRQQARVDKNWAAADMIRDRLTELGVVIEDTPQGARWKWR
ncbi:cysteine--tRNA ligase [Desulfitispora alkaliphila]|uniref:cysteine--tRNA ligase n=1 Tax=Desulfitispora alkaliphila TaxID=622674 RepID=UPI003D251B5F